MALQRNLFALPLLMFLMVFRIYSETFMFVFVQLEESMIPISNKGKSLSCVWQPNNDTECVNLLTRRIYRDATASTYRWLFFGDSTMYRIFSRSPLSRTIMNEPKADCCKELQFGRCNADSFLHFNRTMQWNKPNFSAGEGPVRFGEQNPFCTDCSGCNSRFLWCTCGDRGGGYAAIEFARDVELQSVQHGTTQENWASYLAKEWNSNPDQNRPICVIQAGIHDVLIPNITTELYLENVEWYLQMMHSQCNHIVWLGNTSPKTDDFPQKKNKTLEWNHGIRDKILATHFPDSSSFVDVFDASIDSRMADNIHMTAPFYRKLGTTFLTVMKSSRPDIIE